MTHPFENILQTFIQEAQEQLQALEESLLQLETEPKNPEILGAIFRSAHTIKGSAGLFGLNAMVSFTHILEDVLDQLREGKIHVDNALVQLLLECSDHLRELLNVTVIEQNPLSPSAKEREAGLRAALQKLRNAKGTVLPVVEPNKPVTREVGTVASDCWHISLRLGANILRDGMDPMAFFRYLRSFGRIVNFTTLSDALPNADVMDPETLYLGFEIDFAADVDKKTIADVFEFVSDSSIIHILPPHSKIAHFIELIHSLPESDARLGEILVKSGALTQQELAQCLSLQTQTGNPQDPLGEILVEQGAVEPALVQAALDKQHRGKEQKSKDNFYIRVKADKLDHLINLVGELVIAGAGASLLAQQAQNTAFYEATSQVTDLVEEIRDSALRLRMVPVGDTFNRFQRVVRDVSRDLGKDIELHISGADTEVDKTVVEKISDPLMHLLRNSMDHGIESPEQRIAAGKSPAGKLSLNAFHDSGNIVIEIADDGGGLNRKKILQKAVERNLVAADAQMTDAEIDQLIFEPGFSTAEAVTNLSGRGVGMDVVKRNITELRGSIVLTSQPGIGTKVSIRLPLTLAIIDGFLVGVAQASYVIPLDLVQECVELADGARVAARQRNMLNLRGEVLPLIFLRDYFDLDDGKGRRENVVVVRCAGFKIGLVVDELQGELQTVIKPLGELFRNLRGVSGSTILGSGAVALILDVPALVQQKTQRENRLIQNAVSNNPARYFQ